MAGDSGLAGPLPNQLWHIYLHICTYMHHIYIHTHMCIHICSPQRPGKISPFPESDSQSCFPDGKQNVTKIIPAR